MQNRQKVLNLLGLAQRAGKIVSGTPLVAKAIRNKQAVLIFMANDLHENSRKEISPKAVSQNLPIQTEFNADELSQAIGKRRKVLAVTDRNFAQALIKKINEGV